LFLINCEASEWSLRAAIQLRASDFERRDKPPLPTLSGARGPDKIGFFGHHGAPRKGNFESTNCVMFPWRRTVSGWKMKTESVSKPVQNSALVRRSL
jgi:hypothetical protein